MIEPNRNPAGRVSVIVYGLAEIVDGLIRVLSLGFFHTGFVLRVRGWQVGRSFHLGRVQRLLELDKV